MATGCLTDGRTSTGLIRSTRASNLRGVVIGSIEHGASGNPDADVICNTSNAYVNLLEYQNGDNPRFFFF